MDELEPFGGSLGLGGGALGHRSGFGIDHHRIATVSQRGLLSRRGLKGVRQLIATYDRLGIIGLFGLIDG